MQLCFVATLSQRECVGASVTSADVRRALCQGEVCTQIDTPPQLGPHASLAPPTSSSPSILSPSSSDIPSSPSSKLPSHFSVLNFFQFCVFRLVESGLPNLLSLPAENWPCFVEADPRVHSVVHVQLDHRSVSNIPTMFPARKTFCMAFFGLRQSGRRVPGRALDGHQLLVVEQLHLVAAIWKNTSSSMPRPHHHHNNHHNHHSPPRGLTTLALLNMKHL